MLLIGVLLFFEPESLVVVFFFTKMLFEGNLASHFWFHLIKSQHKYLCYLVWPHVKASHCMRLFQTYQLETLKCWQIQSIDNLKKKTKLFFSDGWILVYYVTVKYISCMCACPILVKLDLIDFSMHLLLMARSAIYPGYRIFVFHIKKQVALFSHPSNQK